MYVQWLATISPYSSASVQTLTIIILNIKIVISIYTWLGECISSLASSSPSIIMDIENMMIIIIIVITWLGECRNPSFQWNEQWWLPRPYFDSLLHNQFLSWSSSVKWFWWSLIRFITIPLIWWSSNSWIKFKLWWSIDYNLDNDFESYHHLNYDFDNDHKLLNDILIIMINWWWWWCRWWLS